MYWVQQTIRNVHVELNAKATCVFIIHRDGLVVYNSENKHAPKLFIYSKNNADKQKLTKFSH